MSRRRSRVAETLYRYLLFAYPAEFRRRFGVRMVELFSECYRAHRKGGYWATVRFWGRSILDVAINALLER